VLNSEEWRRNEISCYSSHLRGDEEQNGKTRDRNGIENRAWRKKEMHAKCDSEILWIRTRRRPRCTWETFLWYELT